MYLETTEAQSYDSFQVFGTRHKAGSEDFAVGRGGGGKKRGGGEVV